MSDLVNALEARMEGHVDGAGITVAVLDTGCFASHGAFDSFNSNKSRALPGRNFTNVGDAADSADTIGHGTAVCGIIAANMIAPIIAPEAKILPLKVVPKQGQNDFNFILNALSWLLGEGSTNGASVVCLSQGDLGNYRSVEEALAAGGPVRQQIAEKIRELRRLNIPTVVAAGNNFFSEGSKTGMCFPAIMPECVSVGAVFSNHSMHHHTFLEYGNARVEFSDPRQLTPFSQRLPKSAQSSCFTRLVAPGAPIVSIGIDHETAETVDLFGTSLAAPIVAGVIALLQARHKMQNGGKLPQCDELERWLLQGAEDIVDNAGEDDNVVNTGATFKLVDALGAIRALTEKVVS